MRKCWNCGKTATVFPPVTFWSYGGAYRDEKQQRGYCEECAKAVAEQYSADKREYIRLKKTLMFERAVRSLEHQNIDIYDYEDAIKAVQDYSMKNLEKLESSDEMIAAIILVDNEIRTEVGKAIGRYRVDFYLPELKAILEIDGERHAGKLYYDNERDIEIRKILGADWEVVRIKTGYLEQNAELLVEAIKAIIAEKKKLRSQNNGLLPDWYSKREFAKKPKKQEYGDEQLLKEIK